MSERDKMMKRVQMYKFALIEANLFLDSHPKDRQALEYFAKMRRNYEKAHREYVEKYGPISPRDVPDTATSWDWIKGPWPWMNESGGER